MDERRNLRKNGSVIVLGQVEYRIDALAGCGGSSVVYKASYEDSLNKKQRHSVLIKELYPWTADGSIFRDGACNICCKKSAKGFFERSRESFLKGNEANLTLLADNPERISGNINSYEAFGTYYSVLSVHGGKNLADLLETENLTLSLRRAAELLIMVLDALESFHSAGILHLDISPDNILMLPSYALLIDYNSVWTAVSNPKEFTFSEKPGYVSPEVRLKEVSNIGPASDLYSVSAIFFRMITGRRLMREEASGAWKKAVAQGLPSLEGAPGSAVRKAMQILQKGLHVLSRKRYQSTAQMKKDLEELILRFDRRGVTAASLWEGSCSDMKKAPKAGAGEMYFERKILTNSGDSFSEEETFSALSDGSLILLSGPGGMGKTSFLRRIWAGHMSSYKEKAPIVFYVPLSGYQEAGEEAYYIHKYLIRRILLSEEETGMDICIQELDRLFDDSLSRRWIFLLDGLNEAGTKTPLLLKEIEELGSRAGVGILVTDRTDKVLGYGLRFFASASLLPLTKDAVIGCLEKSGIGYPKKEDLADALTNPLLLSLYMETARMDEECGGAPGDFSEVGTGDIIGRYMETLCSLELRKDSGDNKAQLRHKFLLEHLLPEIAVSMKQKNRTLFTLDELSECLKRNFQTLRSRNFAKAFPEYLGKSRLMLEGIADEREWFDYAVNEELVGKLGLLEETPGFGYKFAHDNFIDALSVRGKENRAGVNKYKIRKRVKYGIILAAIVAAGIIALVLAMPEKLSQEDEDVIYSATSRLITNTGIIDIQIASQRDILDELDTDAVLSEDEEAVSDAMEVIELELWQAGLAYSLYSDGSRYVDALMEISGKIPTDILAEIYIEPELMEYFMETNAELLAERLCDTESIYNTADKKEPILEAYEEYLDAYTDVYYLKYCIVIAAFGEIGADEAVEELTEYITQASSFYGCISSYSIGSMSEDELEANLTAAENRLVEAKRQMALVNMYY